MNFESARRQMVEQQVRTWDVFDEAILATFESLPRERFVPSALRHCAYADAEIPIGHNQCMLRPSIAARIVQAVDLGPEDDVLEIGTGTGYLTACLAALGRSVTSIDIHGEFIDRAGENLDTINVEPAGLHRMDACHELPQGEFDIIVCTASMTKVEDRFRERLRRGGRLFSVLGRGPAMTATLTTHEESGEYSATDLFETSIPALINMPFRPDFSF